MRQTLVAISLILFFGTVTLAGNIYNPPKAAGPAVGTINGDVRVRSGDSIGFSSSATDSTVACDTCLVRQAANTLALRNGTNSQELRVYDTISGANSRFAKIWFTGGNFSIGTDITGPVSSPDMIIALSVDRWRFFDADGSFQPVQNDNGQDFGGTSRRIRTGYFGTAVVIATGATFGAGQVVISRQTASISAPGAGYLTFVVEPTAAPSRGCNLVAYAGTSTTKYVIATGVGGGGC